MRRDIDITIQEISEALGGLHPSESLRTTEHNTPPADIEKAGGPSGATSGEGNIPIPNRKEREPSTGGSETPPEVQDEDEQDEIRERLKRVAGRLAQEVENEGMSPTPGGNESLLPPTTTATSTAGESITESPGEHSSSLTHVRKHSSKSESEQDQKVELVGPHRKCTCGSSALLRDYEWFRETQQDLLGTALLCGRLHGGSQGLRLYESRKSVAREEGRDWVWGDNEVRRRGEGNKSRAPSTKGMSRPESRSGVDLEEGEEEEEDPKKVREDDAMVEMRQCLIRVYSLLYALE